MDSAFLPLHYWLLLSTIYSAAVFFLVHVVAVHAIVYSLTLSESDGRAEGVKFELGISHRIVKLIFASGFAFAGPTPLFDCRSAGSRTCAANQLSGIGWPTESAVPYITRFAPWPCWLS
jgi:hypothetical protein